MSFSLHFEREIVKRSNVLTLTFAFIQVETIFECSAEDIVGINGR